MAIHTWWKRLLTEVWHKLKIHLVIDRGFSFKFANCWLIWNNSPKTLPMASMVHFHKNLELGVSNIITSPHQPKGDQIVRRVQKEGYTNIEITKLHLHFSSEFIASKHG